jgi:hypothetical protein
MSGLRHDQARHDGEDGEAGSVRLHYGGH